MLGHGTATWQAKRSRAAASAQRYVARAVRRGAGRPVPSRPCCSTATKACTAGLASSARVAATTVARVPRSAIGTNATPGRLASATEVRQVGRPLARYGVH